jgi:hypothetical protein
MRFCEHDRNALPRIFFGQASAAPPPAKQLLIFFSGFAARSLVAADTRFLPTFYQKDGLTKPLLVIEYE